ncbi:hypothetical protein DFA_10555 [Cavenderia fasciculata]|uniref:IPT/TIG domain-containing protein n=1 Tax=Cavenderia fasciculata TaxID=261658 RepID=F4QAJ4_CACFS|nr:uncharacterized protein DFA_10555 [Cavenderia fasciculata]EGG15713.1 hypothetical protein DFA_10555 [Cavenderia fasciculata]|eukprot:XP_004354455.1 hypothetical protein DFA_10555 [Cavenderia fasciculata]
MYSTKNNIKINSVEWYRLWNENLTLTLKLARANVDRFVHKFFLEKIQSLTKDTDVNTFQAQLPAEQVTLLKQLNNYALTYWMPIGSTPGCGSTGLQVRSLVMCNPENTQITGLTIETQLLNLNIDMIDFSVVPYLKSLTFYTSTPVLFPATLLTHKNITTFELIYLTPVQDSTQGMYVDVTRSNWTGMTSLEKVYIDGMWGTLPILPPSVTFVHISAPSQQSLRQFSAAAIHTNLFTPELLVYELNTFNYLLQGPAFNISIAQCTKLQSLQIQSAGYNVDFKSFYNLPPVLTSLRLINVFASTANRTIPLYKELTGWDNLVTLELQGLQLTGPLDEQYFKIPYLSVLNLNYNSLLTFTLPNYLNTSQLTVIRFSGCGLSGSIPANILDNLLMDIVDVSQTSITGELPRVFLCAFHGLFSTNYFISGLVFSNYNGSVFQRDCNPTISQIEPFSTNSSIVINGNDLGPKAPYLFLALTNTMGDAIQTSCGFTIPNYRLECTNPLTLGFGKLQVYVLVNLQYTIINSNFTYQRPSILQSTPCPTLGGRITLYGYDLMANAVRKKDTGISIYGRPCTNYQVLASYRAVSCEYAAGITSNVPISIQVSGLYNNASNDAYFRYLPPNVVSSFATKPNEATQLTITGSDFWNDVSLISVVIEDTTPIPCPVTYANHSYFVCDFPASPYTTGRKNIKVTVNGQTSAPNKLFEYLDETVCPKYCNNNGICDVAIGFCVCNSITNTNNTLFGPSCEQESYDNNAVFSTLEPILEITPSFNEKTVLTAKLISVVENGAEIIIPSWKYTLLANSSTHQYEWTSGAKIVTVSIIPNQDGGSALFGGSYLTFPSNSYTYAINYTLEGGSDDSVQFKFSIDMTPDECTIAPITLASPVGLNESTGVIGDLRWSLLTVYDVEWFTRHPGIAHVNNGGSGNMVVANAWRNVDLGTLIATIVWSFSGFDAIGQLAGEVKNPAKNYPLGVITVLIITIVTYLLPLLVQASQDWLSWQDGQFSSIAMQIGGLWLGIFMSVGAWPRH